ncbi:transcription antitermination factor NusG [Catenulispora sp. MAP12-49]
MITTGPFAGREAEVVRVPPLGDADNAVEVEIEVFQRLVRLSVSPVDLRTLPGR